MQRLTSISTLSVADQAMESGDFELALSLYVTVLEDYPHDLAQLMNAGMCLMALGQFSDAQLYFYAVLAIKADVSHAHHNLGLAYAYQRDHESAVAHFSKTILLQPDFYEAYLDLAQSYQSLGKHEDALTALQKLVKKDPGSIHAYNMMGISYSELNNPDKAIVAYESALDLTNGKGSILANIVKACMLAHDWDRLELYLPKLEKLTREEIEAGRPVSKTPFTSLLISQNLKEVRDHTAAFLQRYNLDVHIAPQWRQQLNKKKRLRIGYLCSDFRNAVNGHLSYKMFAYHNRSRFHVTAISTHPGDDSIYHTSVKESVDVYHQLEMQSNMLTSLRGLKLDILIDMNGLHDPPMLPTLAKRVAPLQMLYLGWAGTSGTQIYDYLVTDRYLTPAEHRRGYSEALLQLNRCYQVASYDPLPKALPNRADYDLPNDAIVYASFFASYKMTRPLFDAWLTILRQVHNSILWVKHTYTESTSRLREYMKSQGVDPERLVTASFVPLPEHMSRLRLVDVALDTWPYNGGASTSNMLYAGVPVIAIKGRHYASRMSTSMLTHLSMPELLTKNPDKYIDLAVKMGNDSKFRDNIRNRLAIRLSESSMFDTEDFVHSLEDSIMNLIKGV